MTSSSFARPAPGGGRASNRSIFDVGRSERKVSDRILISRLCRYVVGDETPQRASDESGSGTAVGAGVNSGFCGAFANTIITSTELLSGSENSGNGGGAELKPTVLIIASSGSTPNWIHDGHSAGFLV